MTPDPIQTTAAIARKAVVQDVPAIFRLINYWADQREMLPKSLHDLFRSVREFWVAEDDGKVIGCAGLRIYTSDLGEICSLAVDPNQHGKGIGAALVRSCLEEAKSVGLKRVFGLTYQVKFFERIGFRVLDKGELPEKVWRDCVNCPFQDDCNETAVIISV